MRDLFEKWKGKLPPGMVKLGILWKETCDAITQAQPCPPEIAARIDAHFHKTLEGITSEIADALQVSSPEILTQTLVWRLPAECNLSHEDRLFEFFYYRETGEPLWELLGEMESEDQSIRTRAFRKLHKIQGKWLDLCQGKRPKPPRNNYEHRSLLRIGLPLGLNKLTSEELADFFEDFCPCGKDHDADSLKKLRSTLHKELQEYLERSRYVTIYVPPATPAARGPAE